MHEHEDGILVGDSVTNGTILLRIVTAKRCDESGCHIRIRKPFTNEQQWVVRKDWERLNIFKEPGVDTKDSMG